MYGNVIIRAASNLESLKKFRVYVNGEPKAELRKKETTKIPLEKNSSIAVQIVAPLGETNLFEPVTVLASNSTEIDIKYSAFLGKPTLVIGKTEKVCDYYEEDDGTIPFLEFDGGLKDSLKLFEDYLVIRHTGAVNAMAMGIKGEKNIYYSDITSVQYKKPSIASGYIQFSLPGGNENKGGVFSAMSDENTIAIKSGNVALEMKAQETVDIINKKIKEAKTGKNAPQVITQQTSSADELKKFKELLDSGIITQEEFDTKKKQLLGL